MKTSILSIWTSLLTCAALAGTLYVDDDNYGKSGLTGESESLAHGTIQDAVDAAASGDTILVLPGDYDKGGKVFNGYSNRVCVARDVKTGGKWVGVKLTIRSTEGV